MLDLLSRLHQSLMACPFLSVKSQILLLLAAFASFVAAVWLCCIFHFLQSFHHGFLKTCNECIKGKDNVSGFAAVQKILYCSAGVSV